MTIGILKMTINTSAGTKIYIARPDVATNPRWLDQSAEWVLIGEVENISTIGEVFATTQRTFFNNGPRIDHMKTVSSGNMVELSIGMDVADEGQKLLTEALKSRQSYLFRATLGDEMFENYVGTRLIFRALVLDNSVDVGDSDSVLRRNASLQINSEIYEIPSESEFDADRTVDLNFAENRGTIVDPNSDSNPRPISELVDFSRGSDGTYFDKNGVLQTAGPNILRLTHEPATGDPLGYLVEAAATNLLPYSYWGSGSRTGWGTLNETNGSTSTVVADPTAYGGYALRVHRPIGGGNISTYRHRGTLELATVTFRARLVSGPVGARMRLSGGNLPGQDYLPELTSEWKIYSFATASGNGNLFIESPQEDTEFLVDWVMVSETPFPTSYIPTLGNSAATRLADSLTISRAGTPEGTVVIEARTALGIGGDQTLWCQDDGTTDNRLWLGRDGGRVLRWIVTVGGVDVIDLDLGVVADNTDLKVAASWGGVNAASLDSAAAVVDSAYSGPIPVVTTQRVGSASDGFAWFGTVARVSDFDKSYSPAKLPEMSNV